jgi:hypothetical protein
MKIVFYHSLRLTTGEDGHEAVDMTNRELRIGEALTEGLPVHGDELIMVPKSEWQGPMQGTDAAMMFGVKSLKMFAPHRRRHSGDLHR